MRVATNTCSSQQQLCLDKHTFVATKDVFCRDKHVVDATEYVCRNKTFVATKKMFVAANICRDKSFVATNTILVAAPANEKASLDGTVKIATISNHYTDDKRQNARGGR